MRATLSAACIALAIPGGAQAHGLWGHVHVTGWAVENMPDDELRQFLLEPEVFNALLFGAVFADTGYALDDPAARAYSEHTHWEPFVEDYIQWIAQHDPPPWHSLESRRRVAFLLGAGSHGLQDSIFDSLFLHQVEEHDGVGQETTDPGTDGFLALDGHIRFIPERDVPIDTLVQLYESLEEEVRAEIIDEAVNLVTTVYINEEIGIPVAEVLGELHADQMPWGREHYMDAAVPGSLQAEIYPTMHYQQALWARLHGELSPEEVTIFAFPEAPRRLRSAEAGTADSWVSLIFGAGLAYEGELVELRDAAGEAVPFTQANSRWGPGHTRLIRLQPTQDLQPGGWYTARLRSGATLIDGSTTPEAWELSFQVACVEETDPACPELGSIPEAHTDGLPKEPEEGHTGQDTASEPTDSGTADRGTPPGGSPPADTATPTESDEAPRSTGCGCSSAGLSPALGMGMGLGLLALVRRRRGGREPAPGAAGLVHGGGGLGG